MINTTNIFDYEDVQLIPNKCIVNSRSECDTHVKLGNRTSRKRLFLYHASFPT